MGGGPPRGSRAPAHPPASPSPILLPLLAARLGWDPLAWGLHEALGAGGPALLGAGGDEVHVGKGPDGSYTQIHLPTPTK